MPELSSTGGQQTSGRARSKQARSLAGTGTAFHAASGTSHVGSLAIRFGYDQRALREAYDTSKNGSAPKPVLLIVLDGIRPDVLLAAIRNGDAPALGLLVEKGKAVREVVSVFPSVTSATTGAPRPIAKPRS